MAFKFYCLIHFHILNNFCLFLIKFCSILYQKGAFSWKGRKKSKNQSKPRILKFCTRFFCSEQVFLIAFRDSSYRNVYYYKNHVFGNIQSIFEFSKIRLCHITFKPSRANPQNFYFFTRVVLPIQGHTVHILRFSPLDLAPYWRSIHNSKIGQKKPGRLATLHNLYNVTPFSCNKKNYILQNMAQLFNCFRHFGGVKN